MKKEAEIILEAEEVMGTGLTQSVIDFGLVEQPQESYQPLPSVWDGDDRDLLELMLNLQPRDNLAKPYQVKQVRRVILQYGLGRREDD
jgi:hypothetical protein